MNHLSGNQFELSIPPIHPPKNLEHSHSSVGTGDHDKEFFDAWDHNAHPFVKVGPIVSPAKTVEHTGAASGISWTQKIPATRTVTPPLFVMPHELAYHSHLGDLGHDDSEVDSHGVPHGETLEDDTPHDLMARKLYAPHPDSADVAGSVEKHGIQVPVDVHANTFGELTLKDGHHRVAAALHHRPNEPVPIDWENIGHG